MVDVFPSEACLRQVGMDANAVGEFVAPGEQASVPSCEGSLSTGADHEFKHCEPAAHHCFPEVKVKRTLAHIDTEEQPSYDHRRESAPSAPSHGELFQSEFPYGASLLSGTQEMFEE